MQVREKELSLKIEMLDQEVQSSSPDYELILRELFDEEKISSMKNSLVVNSQNFCQQTEEFTNFLMNSEYSVDFSEFLESLKRTIFISGFEPEQEDWGKQEQEISQEKQTCEDDLLTSVDHSYLQHQCHSMLDLDQMAETRDLKTPSKSLCNTQIMSHQPKSLLARNPRSSESYSKLPMTFQETPIQEKSLPQDKSYKKKHSLNQNIA